MDTAITDGLDTRLRYLESEVEGEKAVTRHVLEQAIRNGDVLNAVRSETSTSRLDLIALTSRVDELPATRPWLTLRCAVTATC